MRRQSKYNDNPIRLTIWLPILTIIGIGIIIGLSTFYEKSWAYNWNGVSASIKDSVLVTRAIGYLDNRIEPKEKSMEKYSNTRLWIMNNASEKELLSLLKYPNGIVKTIGYEGLLRSPYYTQKMDLVLKSINDREYKVYYSMGCEVIELEISEYLIQRFLKIDSKMSTFNPSLIVDYGLSETEKERILTEFKNRKK